VLAGKIAVGRFLPTEREMAEEHGVAHTTVRRALGRLQADGLIRAEPRKGYRVLSLANDPAGGCPIAFIAASRARRRQWDEFHARLVRELQTAADRRGLAADGHGRGDPRPGGASWRGEVRAPSRPSSTPTTRRWFAPFGSQGLPL